MMMQAGGYLGLAFVLPDYRRAGLADRLFADILAEARHLGLVRLTFKASRLAERFFARKGWRGSADEGDEPPADTMNRNMEINL